VVDKDVILERDQRCNSARPCLLTNRMYSSRDFGSTGQGSVRMEAGKAVVEGMSFLNVVGRLEEDSDDLGFSERLYCSDFGQTR
jgi:hypothetical protein